MTKDQPKKEMIAQSSFSADPVALDMWPWGIERTRLVAEKSNKRVLRVRRSLRATTKITLPKTETHVLETSDFRIGR